MKKTTLNFVIGLFIIVPNFFYSQWGVIPGGDGRTAPGIRSIGIGNFTILDRPKADLNISDFYLPGSTNFLPGSLFRADGNSNVDNNWQLFTGTAANTLTEKFRISVLAPTAPLNTPNDVSISTVQDGRMLFSTNGFNRMFIDNTELNQSKEALSTLIYPNPAGNEITVNTNVDGAKLFIFNLVGQTVFEIDLSTSTKIDLSHLKTGIYIYKIVKANKIIKADKLIISK
jgi:hypothetical protein